MPPVPTKVLILRLSRNSINSPVELMARMGHASARAALIYQHASEARDVVIAEGLSAMVEDALRQSDGT
jgi:hypothetical protein